MTRWQLQDAKNRLSEVSELVRPRPKASVVKRVLERDEDELFLSVITIGELEEARCGARCVNPWVGR